VVTPPAAAPTSDNPLEARLQAIEDARAADAKAAEEARLEQINRELGASYQRVKDADPEVDLDALYRYQIDYGIPNPETAYKAMAYDANIEAARAEGGQEAVDKIVAKRGVVNAPPAAAVAPGTQIAPQVDVSKQSYGQISSLAAQELEGNLFTDD
jgi:hypothetical protein